MKRAIVTPAVLPATALAELKQWLGITTTHDDALLAILLRASIDMCEAFTGQMPLESTCEEVLPARSGWIALTTRPVKAIVSVEALSGDGTRTALAPDGFELELDSDGGGRVRLLRQAGAARIVVRFIAGITADWDLLPAPLRDGALRLAAFRHRERDSDSALQPPVAVAALWRPWRRMRLA